MNKQMKQYLETVVNSIVNEDTEAATAAFHDYLRAKTQAILMNEADDADDADEDDAADDKKKDDKKKDDKKSESDEDKDDVKDDEDEDKDEDEK